MDDLTMVKGWAFAAFDLPIRMRYVSQEDVSSWADSVLPGLQDRLSRTNPEDREIALSILRESFFPFVARNVLAMGEGEPDAFQREWNPVLNYGDAGHGGKRKQQ